MLTPRSAAIVTSIGAMSMRSRPLVKQASFTSRRLRRRLISYGSVPECAAVSERREQPETALPPSSGATACRPIHRQPLPDRSAAGRAPSGVLGDALHGRVEPEVGGI